MTAAADLSRLNESREATDVLDKIVTIRLSAEERELWQAAADYDQRKLADWIRVVVNAHLRAMPDSQLKHVDIRRSSTPRQATGKSPRAKGGR